MAKIYISGPMIGDPDFSEKFYKAEKQLKEKGHTVLNPAIWSYMGVQLDYGEYMILDIAMLSICDLVVLLPGYEHSAGCKYEREVAEKRNIPVMTIEEYLHKGE